MFYVTYDAGTGAIQQWGIGEPPPGAFAVEVDTFQDYSGHRVDLDGLSVVPKTEMTLTVPGGATPADGATSATIVGIPAGTRASFFLGGDLHDVAVDDGTLEIVAVDPQTVSVRLWHGQYQHNPVDVVFA